jgi:hypothetical protein
MVNIDSLGALVTPPSLYRNLLAICLPFGTRAQLQSNTIGGGSGSTTMTVSTNPSSAPRDHRNLDREITESRNTGDPLSDGFIVAKRIYSCENTNRVLQGVCRVDHFR